MHRIAVAVVLLVTGALGLYLLSQRRPSTTTDSHAPAGGVIGGKIADIHSLRDVRGTQRPLHSFTGQSAIVLAFLGVDCPLANLYLPRLLQIERQYRDKGVLFLAVYAHERETIDRAAGHAADNDIPFPVVKDHEQRLADAVGATRTPEVALLDGAFRLRYRGRIDDRYSVGYRRPQAEHHYLIDALGSVLAGAEVANPTTSSDGCLFDREDRSKKPEPVTYAGDIAPILRAHCQDCHRPGQTAPFSLLTYDDAVQFSEMIEEVVVQRRMPPWHADPKYGHFANDPSLSTDEIQKIRDWVARGTPLGDPARLPTPKSWPSGWRIGEPDHVFTMPQVVEVPAEGVVDIQIFRVPTNFSKDRWLQAVEARPGNPPIVHHIQCYYLHPNRPISDLWTGTTVPCLGGWNPGAEGYVFPPGTALRLPAGVDIIFEVHYQPIGRAGNDRSMFGVRFADGPPEREVNCDGIPWVTKAGGVPPHDPHHQRETFYDFTEDARLYSLTPHMHLRGKSARLEAIYPDGKRETLLSVPRYDFNWQLPYVFADPPLLPKGTRLRLSVVWDNSRHNPLNPDPFVTAVWGNQTWNEMMSGLMTYIRVPDGARPHLPDKLGSAANPYP